MAASYSTLPRETRQAILLLVLEQASPQKTDCRQYAPHACLPSDLEKIIYAAKYINKNSVIEVDYVLDRFLADTKAKLVTCNARREELNVQYSASYPDDSFLPNNQAGSFQALIFGMAAASEQQKNFEAIVTQVENLQGEYSKGELKEGDLEEGELRDGVALARCHACTTVGRFREPDDPRASRPSM